jgi:hypothetical protein
MSAPAHRRAALRPAWWLQLAAGMCGITLGWGSTLLGLEPLSRYWFQLTWFGWILTADAVVLAREGRSLLRDSAPRMLLLFALSALFWWSYEWLNWHTRNWSYVGGEAFSQVGRIAYSTVAFATVLPALAEGRDLLRSLTRRLWEGRLHGEARAGLPPRDDRAARAAIVAGVLMGVAIWLFPRQAFPLIWVAPLCVLDGLSELRGHPGALALLRARRVAPVALVALAGLGTGVLWELWNWGADPHWEYYVPYVGFWRLFEMPLLGYFGYLPFALAADALVRLVSGGCGGLSAGRLTQLGPATAKRRPRAGGTGVESD